MQQNAGLLHQSMRSMMAEEDDEDDAISMALRGKLPDVPRGGFLQRGKQQQTATAGGSMDDYIKESEDGLSAALGPRWNSRPVSQKGQRSGERCRWPSK